MRINRLRMIADDRNPLGDYLRSRRARLDPSAFGFTTARRRTPGLRREEVARLADVSTTWYTWLEQGRGGAPSADVLDRLARVLTPSAVEREYLYSLARSRPPVDGYLAPEGVSPRLQRVLDALGTSPSLVRTSLWDIVAWNRAALAVLTDYTQIPPGRRNALRLMFGEPGVREKLPDWEVEARQIVAAFRADAARAGASSCVDALVAELTESSPEFAAFWADNDVYRHVEGTKHIRHPRGGPIALDYSAFAVDGQPNLHLLVYTPATPADAARVEGLIRDRAGPANPP